MSNNEANSIIACVDGSAHTHAVLDAAIWGAKQLHAPIGLLHAHDRQTSISPHDYSGSLGFSGREHLLAELAKVDAERNTIMREHGKVLLNEAKDYMAEKFTHSTHQPHIFLLHRQETLRESIKHLQDDVQLIVLGQKGEDGENPSEHVGSQLETAVRVAHCPALVVTEKFTMPKTALYAFDNRQNTLEGLKWLANHPMFTKTHIHLVFVADESEHNKEELRRAAAKLKQHGLTVTSKLVAGNAKTVLVDYQKQQDTDMLIMGAYGHSRLREFFMGSTTQHLLKNNLKSILMMRF